MISTFSVRAGDFVQQPIGALIVSNDKDVAHVVEALNSAVYENGYYALLDMPVADAVLELCICDADCEKLPIGVVRAGVIEWKRLRGIAP